MVRSSSDSEEFVAGDYPSQQTRTAAATTGTTGATMANVNSSLSASQHTQHRPSLSVHRKAPVLSKYQSTPISKHYDLNNQILNAFESHYENKLYRVAYAIGLRFVETALLEIPKHGYFYSSRHRNELVTSSFEAIRVTNLLQEIQQSDPDLRETSIEQIRLQKLQHLALEQQASVQEVTERSKQSSFDKLDVEVAPPTTLSTTPSAAHFRGTTTYEQQRAAVEKELSGLVGAASSATGDQSGGPGAYGAFGGSSLITTSQELDNFFQPLWSCGENMAAVICPQRDQQEATFIRDETLDIQAQVQQHLQHHENKQREIRQSFLSHSSEPNVERNYAKDFNSADFDITSEAEDDPVFITKVTQRSASSPGFKSLLRRSAPNESSLLTLDAPKPLQSGWSINEQEGQPKLQRDHPSQPLPPPPLASVERGGSATFNDQLQKALYLSGLEVDAATTTATTTISPATLWTDNDDDHSRPAKPKRTSLGPPYQQHHHASSRYEENDLQSSFSYLISPQQNQQQEKSSSAIQTIQMIYHEDFDSYRNMGRIRISHIDTFQGKIPGSTNGCTVIAPLLCIHHFMNQENGASTASVSASGLVDPGLPDSTIIQVVEDESPAILPKIRAELGLVPNAFLIPSDAHDYLIKNQLLSQEQFVTVCGGNILNEDHLNSFITTLQKDQHNSGQSSSSSSSSSPQQQQYSLSSPSCQQDLQQQSSSLQANDLLSSSQSHHQQNQEQSSSSNEQSQPQTQTHKKLAATLFFHEHVIAILKLQRSPGRYWYDIVDSLPSAVTLMTVEQEEQQQFLKRSSSASGNNDKNNHQQQYDGGQIVSCDEEENSQSNAAIAEAIAVEEALLMSSGGRDDDQPINTARIRCLDETALTAALRWYACSRFGEQNLNYIDMYPWDDMNSDFDPRVFQAFIWTEA